MKDMVLFSLREFIGGNSWISGCIMCGVEKER